MAKKHEEEEHADETWLVPYSDVLTLLLALFIVLFAMSKVDQDKFQAMATSFNSIFMGGGGILPDGQALVAPMSPTGQTTTEGDQGGAGGGTDPAEQLQQRTMQQMNTALNAYVESNSIQEMVSIVPTATGFTVRILDSVLFDVGSSELKPAMLPILNRVSAVAASSPYYINIGGHTDSNRGTELQNWDLSSNRALAVLKYMIQQGVAPEKLSATGYGRHHPLLPNITAENMAANRRVDINFITSDFYEPGLSAEGEI